MSNTKQFFIIFCIVIFLSTSSIADQDSNILEDKLTDINIDLLDLEVRYEIGEESSEVDLGTILVYNQLLYYERMVDILGNSQYDANTWNSTEEMLLNAKNKIKALQEKLKISGNWGKVRLKLDPKEQYQKIDLHYIYGF